MAINRTPTNPLESAVVAIETNSNYLTPALITRLLTILPKSNDMGSPTSDLSLESMLSRLGRLVRNLEVESLKSGANPSDIKATINSAKDLFNLVAKHGQAVEAEKKLDVLKRSIVDVLEGFSPEATKKFMKLWEAKLREAQREAEAGG